MMTVNEKIFVLIFLILLIGIIINFILITKHKIKRNVAIYWIMFKDSLNSGDNCLIINTVPHN